MIDPSILRSCKYTMFSIFLPMSWFLLLIVTNPGSTRYNFLGEFDAIFWEYENLVFKKVRYEEDMLWTYDITVFVSSFIPLGSKSFLREFQVKGLE